MLRSLDSRTETFLDGLSQIAQRMARAQREVSTGLRFSKVSDDPDQVSALLQARSDLSSVQDNQTNLGRVKGEVDTGEQALQSAVSVMERIRTLGSQGATGTATADSRTSLAGEIGSLLEQLGSISRTTFEGRYIFSGDSDQTPPYTIDLTQTNPVSAYAGSTTSRQVQDATGTRFSVAKTAQDIFDSPQANQNVLYSVSAMRTALLANDQTGINNALDNIVGSLTYLNGQLSFYGTAQNKVADATTAGSNLALALQSHISTIQDADATSSILDLQQAGLQQQAALEAQGKVPRTTLFDYLA